MKDNRLPEDIGNMLASLKEMHPDKSAAERADLMERLLKAYNNGGVFTAPMLLFLAVSGGLQTFGLHEASRGSSYAPPAWLASMAQLHKKQTLEVPVRRPRP